jgi:hypothetical protein
MSFEQVKEALGNNYVRENFTSDNGEVISFAYTWKDIQDNCIEGTTMIRYLVDENRPFAVEEKYLYWANEFDYEQFLIDILMAYGEPDRNDSSGSFFMLSWSKGDWMVICSLMKYNKYFGAHMYPVWTISVLYRPLANLRAQFEEK